MVLPIYTYGNSVLRRKGNTIKSRSCELTELIDNMFLTLENADGVGLAAHQIGESLSLFIIDYKDSSLEPCGIKKVFINPEIVEYSQETEYFKEGCLSLPGLSEEVKRPIKIKIKYFDEKFNEHIEEYDDVLARIIQHEYDHTQGILFIDKLPSIKKKLLTKKLKLISSNKISVDYKIK